MVSKESEAELLLQKKKQDLLSNNNASSKKKDDEDDMKGFALNLGELDLTTDEIDFESLGEDMLSLEQDEFVRDILQKNVDLREYSKNLEEDLRRVEIETIDDYLKESEHIAKLHMQLGQCDAILGVMEEMLGSFQADLGDISDEIRHLQDESFAMNIKLRNRKSVQKELGTFIDNVSIPPELAQRVTESEVNEAYLEYLLELTRHTNFIQQQANQSGQKGVLPLACKDVKPNLDKITIKVVMKVKDFLLKKIGSLRKYDLHTLQNNVLLKFKYFNQFLQDNGPEAALEVQKTYVEEASKVYFNHFKSLSANLMKLELPISNKGELLLDKKFADNVKKNKQLTRIFEIGNRGDILHLNMSAPAINHQQPQNAKHPYEAIFQSVHLALVEFACIEYAFIMDFFGGGGTGGINRKKVNSVMEEVFTKTLQMLTQEFTQKYLTVTHDVVGVLLLTRITNQCQTFMKKRKNPSLDSYLAFTTEQLWTRFKYIMDMNINAVRQAALPTGYFITDNAKEFRNSVIAQRFAEMACSVQAVGEQLENNTIASSYMSTLTAEVEKLLTAIAQKITVKKNQHIFLINSCDRIITTYQDRNIPIDDAIVDASRFIAIFEENLQAYVNIELREFFPKLIEFATRMEPVIAKVNNSNPNTPEVQNIISKINTGELEALAKDFYSTWKTNLKRINDDVTKSFVDPSLVANNLSPLQSSGCSLTIMKDIFTKLITYYTCFTSIVSLCFPGNCPFRKHMLTVPEIHYEIMNNYIKDKDNQ